MKKNPKSIIQQGPALLDFVRPQIVGVVNITTDSFSDGGKYIDEFSGGKKQRRLTVRECARLQTFPDDYKFVRNTPINGNGVKMSPSEGYKVIGNAVPPLLGFHLAWRLQEIWSEVFK